MRSHRSAPQGVTLEQQRSQTLLDAVEERPLDRHYWPAFAVLSLVFALDYFDMYIVGFLLSAFGPQWQLTYAQTAAILLGAGVGSIIGALFGGTLGDRYGRVPLLIIGNAVCGLMSGAVAFVPDGNWMLFAVLRLGTGVSIGMVATTALALIVERTPRRNRTLLSGLSIIAPSVGVLLASLLAGRVLDQVGWRGLAAAGAMPLLLVPLILYLVPESVHWQVAAGKIAAARANAARLLGRSAEHLSIPARQHEKVSPKFSVVFADPGRFWLVVLVSIGSQTAVYGMYLWAPAILSATGGRSPGEAAKLVGFVSALGVLGKLLFAIVPSLMGRWPAGVLCFILGIVSLVGAAMSGQTQLLGVPLILFFFMGIALFLEGGSANLHPYSAEVFPVSIASRGVGLAQSGNGIAKIAGPVSLALIAGSSDTMRPQATAGAVMPAFLFLSGCALLGLIVMLVVRIETRGKPLSLGPDRMSAGGINK